MTTHFEPPDLETPMQLDPEMEAMRELGGRVIELIAAHRCEVDRKFRERDGRCDRVRLQRFRRTRVGGIGTGRDRSHHFGLAPVVDGLSIVSRS
jgi:hypothetical protein